MVMSVLPLLLLFLLVLFLPHIELLPHMLWKVGVALRLFLWLQAVFLVTLLRRRGAQVIWVVPRVITFLRIGLWVLIVIRILKVLWLSYVGLVFTKLLLLIAHFNILRQYLFVIRGWYHVVLMLLNPALGIWVHRAAPPNLSRMLLDAVVVIEIGPVAHGAECPWIDFIHHRVIQHWVAIIGWAYINLAQTLWNTHWLLLILVALAWEIPCMKLVVYRLDNILQTFASVLLWQRMLLYSCVGCIWVHWAGRSSLYVFTVGGAQHHGGFYRGLNDWIVIWMQVINLHRVWIHKAGICTRVSILVESGLAITWDLGQLYSLLSAKAAFSKALWVSNGCSVSILLVHNSIALSICLIYLLNERFPSVADYVECVYRNWLILSMSVTFLVLDDWRPLSLFHNMWWKVDYAALVACLACSLGVHFVLRLDYQLILVLGSILHAYLIGLRFWNYKSSSYLTWPNLEWTWPLKFLVGFGSLFAWRLNVLLSHLGSSD